MNTHYIPIKCFLIVLLSALLLSSPVQADISQQPLFLTTSVPPIVMLTMGRDHKLFYEAYNDASDLDGDGLIDVGYKPEINYYGYFDSYRCYDYDDDDGGVFTPKAETLDKTCASVDGDWSGDFLNYITTARIDALRKVLYGGYRSEDTTSSTILKRSFIPQDAHSWGKEYDPANKPGYSITDYTPLNEPALGTRHLFANVSLSYTGQPLMRVLNDTRYRIWEWVSIERPVAGTKCLHGGSGPNCAQAGGSTWSIVPSTVLSNLVRTTYDIASGTGSGHPDNHTTYNTWITNYAVDSRKFGSGSMTTLEGNDQNPYGADDNYLTRVTGKITVPTTGTYKFSVDGDDAVEVIINNTVVASWYGGHGKCNCDDHNGTISLTAGTQYDIEFRHEERGGADSFVLRWESVAVPNSVITNYSVNVEVCKSGQLEDNCKAYTNNATTTYKPIGLLQTYGENDSMAFGLLTGSYKKNISGGVLRKNISSFKNEVDPDTGVFTNVSGIVDTINKLRINTFNYSNYEYASGWITTRPINEGEAPEWGNPVAEMMYEGLRYFAGKATPTSSFAIPATGTPDATLGLPQPNWLDPYQATDAGGGGYLSCAKPMQLVISDVNVSYDTDQLPGSTFNSFSGDLTGLNVSDLADKIWQNESEASSIFIGQSGSISDGAPTAKSASSFKDIRGLAPEEPTKLGGFYAGSVALYGAQTDLHAVIDDQKVDTLAVALASPLPRIEIPVEYPITADSKKVTLVPFAKSVKGLSISSTSSFQPTNQIVDFYVEKIVNTSTLNMDATVNDGRPYGKFRINYEDVEQAADHDMDAIVEYIFSVNASNQVVIQLNSTYAYGGITQHMGYVISGTTADGVYLEVRDQLDGESGSDTDYRLDTPPGQPPGGTWADGVALPFSTTRTFNVGATTSASYIQHDPLWYAAKWGSQDTNDDGLITGAEWDAPTEGNTEGDGVPDGYFLVTNAGKLPEQLAKAFAKLLDNVSSASAVAANTTRLDTGTLVYQAKFDPKDWSGQLLALSVDEITGDVNITTPNWEAASVMPTASSRKIMTYNPAAEPGERGIYFEWSPTSPQIGITDTQKAYLNQITGITDGLGEIRLNWLRGDNSNEERLGGTLRNRVKLFNNSFITNATDLANPSIPTNKLGDIVNSDPIYVGTDDFGYSTLPSPEGGSYTTFRSSDAYQSRRPMLYVGANDGMLHGFDGRKNTGSVTTGGEEIFAYLPNAVFPELSKLSSPGYSHQYFVDGVSTFGDVYFGSAWHTLLAGVTGAGGKAIFALDITNPDEFGPASALWEFTNANDVDLGYTLAQPAIGKMNNGKWAVIVGNGYNSSSDKAVLFILDAENGTVIKKIDTGAVGANGLSAPAVADLNGDHKIDVIYAGDLQGNLWKFDVSAGSESGWTISNSAPLFVACSSTGTDCSDRQPITAKPAIGSVGADQGSGVMVLFGTGKYFETTDNVVGTDPQVQTFYGLWDNNLGPITDRAELQEQTITFEGAPVDASGNASTGLVRATSRNTVCYAATSDNTGDDNPITCTTSNLNRGWALNLIPPTNIAQSERVVTPAILYQDLVIFSSLIPSPNPCKSGGDSRVMLIEALTGKRPLISSFDLFGTDNKFNDDDKIKIADNTFVFASGISLGINIHKNISTIGNYGYASGSSGELGKITLNPGASLTGSGIRRSWQQLR